MSTTPQQTAIGLESYQAIHEKIIADYPSVMSFYPGSNITAEGLNKATTIVVFDHPDYRDHLDFFYEIPPFTPILVISMAEKESLYPVDSKDRLVDTLRLPISSTFFSAKLSFFKKIYTIAAEHYNQATLQSSQLDVLYRYDALTGLRNRRQFTKDLEKELELAAQTSSELTLLIFNIDFFNDINKRYGLDFGDHTLNELAARATATIERPSICYRYSTEDFAALLPGCDLQRSHDIANKLRDVCSSKPFADSSHSISISISVGLSSVALHKPENHEKFIFMAESALFSAKASGRNQVQTYLDPNSTDVNGPENSLGLLKDKLNRILEKTRTSAISSLQHLAKSTAGPAHKVHAARVSNYTNLLCEQMGFPATLLSTFHNSITLYTSLRFLLHNDLLAKPEKLTREEWKIIEDLPFKIQELTEIFDYFNEERKLLLCQAENYDGSGYPEGLSGDEIPIGARILKIVDSLAAMKGERPYRKKLSHGEIVRELLHGAGKQFDPILVLQFLKVIEKNNLLDTPTDYLIQAQKDLAGNLNYLQI